MGLIEDLQESRLPTPRVRRSIRVTSGASLRDVAAEMGRRGYPVSAMTVLKWERGEMEPRRDRAAVYRRLLGELQKQTREPGMTARLSRAEILGLPPAHLLPDTGRALGVSEPVIREMARSGRLDELGIKVVKLGAQYRVVTASLWAFLGISPDGAADGAGSEARPRRDARQRRPSASALPSVSTDEAG